MSISHPLQHRTLDRRRFLGGSAIAAVLQQSPLGLAWLDPEIETLEDMIGKRIGGSPDSPLNIDAAFAANDLPNDYEFVPIGFDPAPLANGEIDVIVCFVTYQPTVLDLQGLEPVSRTFSDFGTPLYADAIIGKRGYLDENRARGPSTAAPSRRSGRSSAWPVRCSRASGPRAATSSRPRRTSGRPSCELPEVDVLMDLSFLEEAYDGRTSLLDDGG